MPALLLLTLLGLFAIGTIAACRAPGRDRRLGVLLLAGGAAWLALYGAEPVSPEGERRPLCGADDADGRRPQAAPPAAGDAVRFNPPGGPASPR